MLIEIRTTEKFSEWFSGLRDRQARARIQARIDRAELGNFGDCRPVGDGVSEMRIHYGPGYRVYFYSVGQSWPFYSLAATRILRKTISSQPSNLRANCRRADHDNT